MVSASSEVQQQHIDSLWSITQVIIGFGAVACMCCVLFLGLKLKWFRAQFKVQDMPKTKKSSDTVQGIGFKIKTNSEDFQQYKSISEFATPDANITSIPTPNNKNNSNDIPQKQKAKPNTSAKDVKKNKVPSSEKLNVNTETPSISIPTPTTKKKTEIFEETSTKREIRSQITTQESSEYNSKTETEIKTSEKKEKKSKVTFAKNKTVHNNQTTTETEHEQIENVQVRSEENTFMQMRKPLSAQNIVMPQEDEDNWQIRIVGETQKVQIDNRHDDIYYEEIRLENDNNSNSNSISNSMYSSQAASIFFGSYDEKQVPDSPPPPIPRKFLEDDDAISMSSQTSA